jgi:dTDP-4-dehydrorhamnose 3,5-epimerase
MSLQMEKFGLDIPGPQIIRPRRFDDHRGFFSETWSRRGLAGIDLDIDFVQDNHSLSLEPETVRGLHYQTAPFAQAKLVRVVRGAILDICVDIRWGSPTFGRHISHVLSARNWEQIFVPVGFAHGFRTLEPATEVIYKVSEYYSAPHDRGLRWDDPALGIDWGVSADHAVLSDRDRQHPLLRDLPRDFVFDD